MTTTTRRRIGDQVSVDHPTHPGVWTIKSMGPVNAVLEQKGRRPLRAPISMLTDPGATRDNTPPEFYDVGELVRIPTGRHAGLWVVIADRGADRVNLAKLGGDSSGYLRSPKRGLIRIDAEPVLAKIMEAVTAVDKPGES